MDDKQNPVSLHAYDEIVLSVWLGELVGVPVVGLLAGTILETLFLEHFAGDLLRGAGVLTSVFVFLSAQMKVSALHASIHVVDPRQQRIFEISRNLQFWSMGMLAVYAVAVSLHCKVHAKMEKQGDVAGYIEVSWSCACFAFNVLVMAFTVGKSLALIQESRAKFLDLYISAIERETSKTRNP